MEKVKTKINIGGIEYTIAGYETEEYMQRVAIYVDRKMKEVRQNCFSLDSVMTAVLTAVNIADENIKLSDRIKELEEQIEELNSKVQKSEKAGKKK